MPVKDEIKQQVKAIIIMALSALAFAAFTFSPANRRSGWLYIMFCAHCLARFQF